MVTKVNENVVRKHVSVYIMVEHLALFGWKSGTLGTRLEEGHGSLQWWQVSDFMDIPQIIMRKIVFYYVGGFVQQWALSNNVSPLLSEVGMIKQIIIPLNEC